MVTNYFSVSFFTHYRCLGSGKSFSTRDAERKTAYYEDIEDARKRVEQDSIKIAQGIKRKKNHTGSLDKVTWDKQGLLNEVKCFPDGQQVNWSSLARKYNITNRKGEIAKNGGQIAQDWVISQGENIHRFKSQCQPIDSKRIRRKRLRGQGGEIPLPTPESATKLKEKLKQKLLNGDYTLGEAITPRCYEKMVIKDGKLVIEEFVVEGRKLSLQMLRDKTLKKHEQFMRLDTDQFIDSLSEHEVGSKLKSLNEYETSQSNTDMREKLKKLQRTRNFIIWHDASTIADHGHVIMMVNVLYDPAVHLTDNEYKEKYGQALNVQAEIERPELYIIGRCRANDEQLGYIDTRVVCLKGLEHNLTVNGIDIKDVMRFFHGDGPAAQFESGQQKGGNFFCSCCGIFADRIAELDYALNCPYLTLEDKRTKILYGAVSGNKTMLYKLKPLDRLTKTELLDELVSRGLCTGTENFTKDVLQNLLTQEMRGIQCVPALCFNNPEETMEDLGISSYEVLPCESMHDIGNFIQILFEELPHHVDEKGSEALKQAIETSLNGQEQIKRTVDHRCALLQVSSFIRDKIDDFAQTMLSCRLWHGSRVVILKIEKSQ